VRLEIVALHKLTRARRRTTPAAPQCLPDCRSGARNGGSSRHCAPVLQGGPENHQYSRQLGIHVGNPGKRVSNGGMSDTMQTLMTFGDK
jgi:hypothetical protein